MIGCEGDQYNFHQRDYAMATVNNSTTLAGTTISSSGNSQTSLPMLNGGLALIAASAAVSTVGVVTNGLALVVIFAFTTIWKKINFFLLVNQCFLAACQYFSIVNGDPNVFLFQIKLTNDAVCSWWYSKAWMWSMILSSNYNVVMVTCERYLKIVHPVTYHNHMTKVLRTLLLAFSIYKCTNCIESPKNRTNGILCGVET